MGQLRGSFSAWSNFRPKNKTTSLIPGDVGLFAFRGLVSLHAGCSRADRRCCWLRCCCAAYRRQACNCRGRGASSSARRWRRAGAIVGWLGAVECLTDRILAVQLVVLAAAVTSRLGSSTTNLDAAVACPSHCAIAADLHSRGNSGYAHGLRIEPGARGLYPVATPLHWE